MKYILLFFILISTTTLAQEWEHVSKFEGETGRFDDIHYYNRTIATTGMNTRYVAFSTDKGKNWVQKFVPSDGGRSLKLVNDSTAIVSNLTYGNMYRTTDLGDTWDEIIIQDTSFNGACGMTIYNDSTIFGVGTFYHGATLIKSTDYGLTWETKDLNHLASGLVDIKFYNEDIGIATGTSETGAVVLRTTDAGESWGLVHKTQGEEEYAWKIDFTNDSSHTFISVQALVDPTTVILKSSDMGATWSEIEHPYTQIQGICFWDKMNGAIGGWGLPILNTTDGGQTWVEDKNLVNQAINRFLKYDKITFAIGANLFINDDIHSSIEVPAPHSNKNLDISVFSNQNKTVVNITANNQDQIHYYIYDLNGNVLKSRVLVYLEKGINSIDLDNELTRGVYFISLLNNEGIYKHKFMVE